MGIYRCHPVLGGHQPWALTGDVKQGSIAIVIKGAIVICRTLWVKKRKTFPKHGAINKRCEYPDICSHPLCITNPRRRSRPTDALTQILMCVCGAGGDGPGRPDASGTSLTSRLRRATHTQPLVTYYTHVTDRYMIVTTSGFYCNVKHYLITT